MFEDPHVAVRQRDRRTWTLLEKVRYQGNHEVFVVPPGSHTDFASVPRPVIWLIPTYGVYTPAAILHDYLCVAAVSAEPLLSRADADGLFRRSLRELGVSGPKRWSMWAAVRAGSGLRGASVRDVLLFLLVAIPAIVVLLVPVVVVTVGLGLAWLIESAWWLWPGRGGGRRRPADVTRLRT